MSETTASLRRKISSAGDLQSVVRTMKALAASSIGQYEKSVSALATTAGPWNWGLARAFGKTHRRPQKARRNGETKVGPNRRSDLGSDQGLVGQFNDIVADYAIKTLAALPGKPHVWAVGERVHARLADAGLSLMGLFTVPNSVQAITPLVGQIQIESEAHRAKGEYAQFYVFHKPPAIRCTLRAGGPTVAAARRTLGGGSGQCPLADQEPARDHGWRHHDAARTNPRIPFHLALPGLRRVPCERKREPPGGDATGRQKTSTTCWRRSTAPSTSCARAASTKSSLM